ncbi:MAG: MerR family transcriptional regulator [Gemmatimonadota bacterium]
MFSIGEFARLGAVSIRTLRHHDEIGLLPPAEADPVTGYRSYSAEQLRQLNRIVALLSQPGQGLADGARPRPPVRFDREPDNEPPEGVPLRGRDRGQAGRQPSCYLFRCLRLSFTMRAPRVAAAPPSIPLVMVSLCSVPNFLAVAIIGSAAAWNPSSKAPEPVAAS